MGLKSGSRDAGLEETESDDEAPEESEVQESTETNATERDTEAHESQPTAGDDETTDSTATSSQTEQTDQRPAMSSIPYKLRREKVNEGREQVPYFLREEIIDAEDELQNTLEELLDEDVYKSDYREAAMVVAQRNPKLVAEVLREWGYDLETT